MILDFVFMSNDSFQINFDIEVKVFVFVLYTENQL